MLFLNTSSVIILLLLGVNTITGYVANSCYRTNHAFKSNKITSSRRYLAEELDVGEVENIKFTKIGEMGSDLNKYRIEGTIKSKQLNVYLEQYKDEMRSRKVIFPGFRPGKLPPYVMPDIRKYIISFGLETIFVELCNLNNLILMKEDKTEPQLGDDEFFEAVIQKDFRNFDFQKQRDTWREGTDFTFAAEFLAKVAEDEGEAVDSTSVDKSSAIDVEAVSSSSDESSA